MLVSDFALSNNLLYSALIAVLGFVSFIVVGGIYKNYYVG